MVNAVAKILAAFIMLIVGLSLIVVVAGNNNSITELTTKTETVNIAPARLAAGAINTTYAFTLDTGLSNWRNDYSECIPTTITFKNQTGGTLTDPTDYVYTYNVPSGQLTLENVANLNDTTSNTTTATYSYCPDGYMALNWGRTSLDTTLGLFAVGLMLGAVALTVSIFKDFGFY